MKSYSKFIFKDYHFNVDDMTLSLSYGYDDDVTFIEKYTFDVPNRGPVDTVLLDAACQTLFFLAGVSYYKMYLAPEIEVRRGQLDAAGAAFFGKTYERGLGEFFYINNMNPATSVTFPVTSPPISAAPSATAGGMLVAVGGGKDSLVSVEVLRSQPGVTTWSLGHKSQLTPLIERIGLPHFWVSRSLDPTISEHNANGAYNGHVPISAIFAAVGTVVAVLSGKRDLVLSNESSASDPTLLYQGVAINHQYSKSLEFEQDYQAYLAHRLGDNVRYYSLLRPLTELHIAKIFSRYFDTYKDVFSSCNRAFTQNSTSMFWCGECAKCAFACLIFSPFLDEGALVSLWGRNLLLDPALETTYKQLLGIEGDKPLDCVGEVKESRAALQLAQVRYPELNKYDCTVPKEYDYTALSPHAMPPEAFTLLTQSLA